MKINVLYIIWSLGLGGAEQVVINLAKGLDRNRFQPFICCLNDEGLFADELKAKGIKVFALKKKSGIDLAVIGQIKEIITQNYIHVVHTHLWGANLWGRIAGILAGRPVVITEHNVDVWKKWYHKVADYCLVWFTAKVCVVSERVKKFYHQRVRLPIKKIEVVYNGIDPMPVSAAREDLDRLRQDLHLKKGVPVVVNIGRLVEAKANHIFIKAVRVLLKRDISVQALIVGDGPLMEQLQQGNLDLIHEGKIVFAGLRKDVPAILDLADISVLSSTREGFSIVVLECMAKGIPFVATDVGGNSEQIVDGQTGFLVPRGDIRALADAIEKVLKNPTLKASMGEASKKIIREKFSLERMVQQMERIYQELKK